MTARKTFLLTAVTALAAMPAWAQASSSHSQGHGPSTAPGQLKDADEHSGTHGKSGSSHKCKPHGVAFVLSGTVDLEKTKLEKNADGTYSGEIAFEGVTHANHHAKNEKGPISVKNVHIGFDNIADANADGSVGLDDLVKGDTVKLIGKITKLAKKCDHTGFTATTTIRKVTFSAPAA